MSPADFAINGRFFGQPVTGVQRYGRQVVQALDFALGAGTTVATVVTPKGVLVPVMASIRHVTAGPGSGHAWEQAVLPLRSRGRLLNLCNTAPVTRTDQIVCIHDANVFRSPESYSPAFRTLYQALLPALASRSARIATVSADSARQLSAHLRIKLADIVVLPNGHEHALLWDASCSTTLVDLSQTRPYVLALGSRARHKNLQLLLSLAPSLDALGLDLLVAGSSAGVFAEVSEAAYPNVRRLGAVSDDDLAALMDQALCLAFPSFTEGFGLPIVEAMARGCPVVSSDRASMPEVCGTAALMAGPEDLSAWHGHFARLAGSQALRSELAGKGREQARHFSWAQTADGYLSLMTDPISAPRRRPASRVLPRAAVVVATRGRPEVVTRTVDHLVATQTLPLAGVLVSCASSADAGACATIPGVRVVNARPGLAAQRNAALETLPSDAEIVVFFDDDFVADPEWVAAAAQVFRDEPDVVALTGDVLADDIKGPGFGFDEAVALVGSPYTAPDWTMIEPFSPYGCNMAYRVSAIRDLRFDERLVLYGWLEDRDFAAALAHRGGRLVKISSARGVHMGAKAGRIRGERLGYSQVINPLYMNRKGTMKLSLVAGQMARNVGSNLAGIFRPEPHVDRIGRLRGNLRGFVDAARGQIDPERAALL